MKRQTGMVRGESSVKRLRTVNVSEESDKERDKRVRQAEYCRRYRQRQKEKAQEIRNNPSGDEQPSTSAAKSGIDSEQRARKAEYQRRYRLLRKQKDTIHTNTDNAQPSTSTAVNNLCGTQDVAMPSSTTRHAESCDVTKSATTVNVSVL